MSDTMIIVLLIVAFVLYLVHIAILSTQIELQKEKISKLDIDSAKYKHEAELWRDLSHEDIDKVCQENLDLKKQIKDFQMLRQLDKGARDRLIEEINLLKEYNQIIEKESK